MIEGDSKTKADIQETQNINSTDVGDVFPTFRIRRAFCCNNEMDRFFLDYGCNFLPAFGAILYLLLFLFT